MPRGTCRRPSRYPMTKHPPHFYPKLVIWSRVNLLMGGQLIVSSWNQTIWWLSSVDPELLLLTQTAAFQFQIWVRGKYIWLSVTHLFKFNILSQIYTNATHGKNNGGDKNQGIACNGWWSNLNFRRAGLLRPLQALVSVSDMVIHAIGEISPSHKHNHTDHHQSNYIHSISRTYTCYHDH